MGWVDIKVFKKSFFVTVKANETINVASLNGGVPLQKFNVLTSFKFLKLIGEKIDTRLQTNINGQIISFTVGDVINTNETLISVFITEGDVL